MNGIIMLFVYAAIMILATVTMTKKEKNVVNFCVGSRSENWILSALSIAATWIWAPALFVSTEKAYSAGWIGLFWFLVPNALCLVIFIPFAKRIRKEMPEGMTLSGYMKEKYSSDGVKRVYLFQLIGLSVLSTGVQLLAGSQILSAVTGISFKTMTILLACIAISYSLFSGIKASMLTDAIQMVFMLVACSLFVIFGVRNTGTQGIIQGLSGISGDYTTLFSGKGVEIFLAFGLPTTIGLLSGPFGDQSFWQRAFAVKKEKLGKAFLLGAILFAIIPLSMGILGLMGAGTGYQAQDLGTINFELIRHFFPSWAVLPFLFMIISGLLSTVDSNLCAVSSLTTDLSGGKDIRKTRTAMVVLLAAEIRIKNVFDNGLPVFFSFSGGKDSLCVAQLLVNLANRGEIDMKQLTVQFIDEEAIFPCMEEITKKWRRIFMMMGAKFEWYCIEVKHFNCFNQLLNDETFICWDSEKKDVWVRQPPSFAIRSHKLLKPRTDAYQDFLPRISTSGITMVGIRTAESIQRLWSIASMTSAGNKMTERKQIFPIYDWKDKDVWIFLLRNHVDIPEIYLFLWQSGSSKRQMRVSQFFSVDTARSLVKMNEYYPDLMERVIRREPNAYLAALYWDSEMFGRSSRKRKESEQGQEQKDYKQELINLFDHMEIFDTPHKRHVAERYRNFFIAVSAIATPEDCKHIYEGLISGDPKMRTFRALYQRIYGRYINNAKKERKHG